MSRARKSTMVELVEELEKLQHFFEKPSPIDFLIAEAKAGEFHDYKNQRYDCGKVAVCGYLDQLTKQTKERGMLEASEQLSAISAAVKNGEFDEEADAEDQKMLSDLIRGMAEGRL